MTKIKKTATIPECLSGTDARKSPVLNFQKLADDVGLSLWRRTGENRACSSFVAVYFSEGTVYGQEIESKREITNYWARSFITTYAGAGGWTALTKLPKHPIVLLNWNEAKEWLLKKNPYVADMLFEDCFGPAHFILAPQLEQLIKAGYSFPWHLYDDVEAFNRLTKPGRNMKEIFKCSRALAAILKDENRLSVWDAMRKIEKCAKASKEELRAIYEHGFRGREIKQIDAILRAEYDGKRVFTFDTLLRFLGRVNMFQAIPESEAIPLLSDYLAMCRQMNIRPNIESDSLKREHDVAARNLRTHRNEELNQRMQKYCCNHLAKFDYQERLYTIRGVRDYNDLLDEANQMHNCVAGYSGSILRGRSLIFFMRESANPDKSLITVELVQNNGRYVINQKYQAYNRPVRNRAQSEFLNRWVNHVNKMAAA